MSKKSTSFNFIQFHSILTILLISLLSSCSPENITEQANTASLDNKRQIINQLNPKSATKVAFSKLSSSQQKAVWINKFEQIKSRNLSTSHSTYLSEIIALVKETKNTKDIYNPQIEEVLLELLKITPREDFIQMFMSLSDYTGNFDINNVEVCNECITKLQNEFKKGRELNPLHKTSNLEKEEAKGRCDCDWTCGWGAGDTHSYCVTTPTGCGWFWQSACTQTDFPT